MVERESCSSLNPMHAKPTAIMKPSPKQNIKRPRAKPLSDLFAPIFADIERGSVRDFFHFLEVLPAVFQRVEGAITKEDDSSRD